MSPRTPVAVYFDPFDPLLHTDPYARYAEAREAAPVCDGPHGLAVLTRHRDVSAALRDDNLGHGPATAPNKIFSFLGMDPPEHGPLRRIAARFFSPQITGRLATTITGFADDLLDTALDKREVDLLADFAYPLSLRVICSLFGLPEADQPWIREQNPPIGRLLDPPYSLSQNDLTAGRNAAAVFVAYLRRQINDRRNAPRDDLLSTLTAEAETGGPLDRHGLIPMCALLLMAGYETTANIIANAALALLRHPAQLADARNRCTNGPLDKTSMDELLRYDSSIQATFRTLRRDAVIGGTPLSAGTPVALLIGSANHDPRVFTRPDELDLDRSPNPHLSFGAGLHYCLGAPLARLEAGIALSRLLHRTRRFELDGVPRHKDITAAIRGVDALPVVLTSR
ncbi:cytochrome P450 [Amycolatopsis speibonae]|uniref:Cytochrome P450 n=1 Tax=Amycolatopsis speibonae TaxID=1450224 RepID=A0ABV7NX55_9PSEU